MAERTAEVARGAPMQRVKLARAVSATCLLGSHL